MMQIKRSLVLCAALVILIGGCAAPRPITVVPVATLNLSGAASTYTPRFEPRPCWWTPDLEGLSARCGTVTVPEDRSELFGDRNQIKLAAMILHRQGSDPNAAPTILLVGGPGDAAIDSFAETIRTYQRAKSGDLGSVEFPGREELARQLVASFEWWLRSLRQRDLVLLDQRGAGHSEPSLDCRDESLSTCHARLVRASIDLSAYRTVENAADVDDMRRALGYPQVNLTGGSYGSRLGLVVMRDFPESVRSAAFCSISPPHVNHFVESVRLYPQVLNALFSRCAADAICHKAYPDLETEFYAVIQRLNDQPLVFEVRLPTGGSHTARISGDAFRQLVWEAMYVGNSVRFLPMLIHDIYDGKVAVLQEYLRLAGGQAQPFFSEGLYHTVNCAEEVGLTTREEVIAAASDLPTVLRESVLRGAERNAARCADWTVPPINRDERRPVVSDVPTLLLSGEFDSGTPPMFGEAAVSKFSRGHHIILPGLGHCEVYASACMAEIQTRFFDDPMQPPDTHCIANMPKFTFAVAR